MLKTRLSLQFRGVSGVLFSSYQLLKQEGQWKVSVGTLDFEDMKCVKSIRNEDITNGQWDKFVSDAVKGVETALELAEGQKQKFVKK